ncbi:MAG: hypothetical protein WDN06_08400 [Asticcacaulis sp.]
MSTYNASTNTGTKPDSTISMNISDSLGQEHTVTMSLLKKGVDTTSGLADLRRNCVGLRKSRRPTSMTAPVSARSPPAPWPSRPTARSIPPSRPPTADLSAPRSPSPLPIRAPRRPWNDSIGAAQPRPVGRSTRQRHHPVGRRFRPPPPCRPTAPSSAP